MPRWMGWEVEMYNVFSKILGERIAEKRKESGLTQAQLAEKINVKREIINYWENGSRDIKAGSIVLLAKVLGVSTDFLLGIEDGTTHQATADLDALGLDEECLNIILQAKGTDDARKIAFLLKNKDKIFDLIERWEK